MFVIGINSQGFGETIQVINGGIECNGGNTAEMQDRVQTMAAQIASDGPAIRTKAGIRAHPLLKEETAGRGFIVRTLSKLGVVYAEVRNPGRPGVGFGWTGA